MSANGKNRLGQILTKNPNNNLLEDNTLTQNINTNQPVRRRNENLRENYSKIEKILRQIKCSSANKIYEHQIVLTLTDLNKHSKEQLQKYCNWTEHKLSEPLSTNQLIL